MAITRFGQALKGAYTVIQTDYGTYPTVQNPSETLTLTSSDGSVIITGDLATDTVDLTISPIAGGGPGANMNIYSSVSSVASGSTTDVVSYTVPPAKTFYLELIEFNGTNIAKFEVEINAIIQATKHTWFSGGLFGQFEFDNLLLSAGDVVKLTVLHMRPNVGDFYGRILGTEL